MTTRETTRKPIVWAVSISKLRLLVQNLIPSYAPFANIQVIDKAFDDALETLQKLMRSSEVDVLVSAGSNGAYLREHVSVPVALIKVSGFDMLEALSKAREHSDRIAIVTFETINPDLEQFKTLYNLNIELLSYKTARDAKACVKDLATRGTEVVVGPGLVTELAEQAGLKGIFLYSEHSVREALDNAIEIARVTRIEEARRERLNTILRSLDEGVVAVDTEERIQTLNPAMEKLLGISAELALGRRLSEMAPGLGLQHTLQSGTMEIEKIQRLGNRTVVTNRMPIHEQGIQTGAVLTYHDSTAIQRVERNIRTQNKPRQFLAKYRLSDIIGNSAAITQTRTLAQKYAKTDATVLITGDSGTGKELLAQGIHNSSRRKHHQFVAINCAALPESLLESELFGYEEGAFSGSRRGGKAGLFESAHTGTIFLDEVGDMPIALQTRLLRVLQEKEVLRLGSNDPTPVDVRVIAATNRNLKQCVQDAQFREDLYYRLNILTVHLPPLSDRFEDIPTIAAHLFKCALRRLQSMRKTQDLLPILLPQFQRYSWPGNVREMENIIERIVVFYSDLEPTETIEAAQLRAIVPELFQPESAPPYAASKTHGLKSVNRANELSHIQNTIDECGGNLTVACKRLGIARTTLWRKLNGRR